MLEVESQLKSLLDLVGGFVKDVTMLDQVQRLEGTKNKLLLKEELDCRIKCRETYILEGYGKTKYFQNFSSHRKKKNTICELENENGEIVHSFGDFSLARVRYFENFFTKPKRNSFGDTLRVIENFLRFISSKSN